LKDMLSQLSAGREYPLLKIILESIGITILLAAAVIVLFVILRPLFSRETMRGARKLHPLKVLKARFTGLLRSLASIPRRLAQWLHSPGKRFASVPRAVRAVLRQTEQGARREARARERAGRAVRNRAVREFLRLARWGEKKGIAYRVTEGPMEYARMLEARVPEKAPALETAALLFEELVYSDEPEHGQRELAPMVNGIVK
jgi:hypothetical protein